MMMTMTSPPPSPLHAAVQVADLIRTSIGRSREDGTNSTGDAAATGNDWWFSFLPAGSVDGLVAGCAVLAILTPVRSRLIRYAGNQWGMLPDLFLSSSQAVASCTAALYIGSLQGSRFHLKKLARADPNRDAWVPGVCSSSEVQTLLNSARTSATSQLFQGTETDSRLRISPDASDEPQGSYFFAQDPRRQTMEELARALETCRRLSTSSPSSNASYSSS